MSKIKILIADDVEETRNLIIRLLSINEEVYEIVAQAGNGQEVIDLIPACKPDIVLMDINMPVMNGLEAAEIIESKFPAVMVIIMSVQSDHEYLKKAMFIGAKDYIIKPFTSEQLIDSVENTYRKYHDRQVVQAPLSTCNAKILSFFSTKGGVGKSVLAANYALFLGKNPANRILLWDLDLQFGDQALLFDKQKSKTLTDLIDDTAFESISDAEGYITPITDNVHVLCAPPSPEKAEYISKELVKQLLTLFKAHYDYILLDLGVNYDEITLIGLDHSDKVFFITTPDLLSLKNTKLGLNVMKSLNYEYDKVGVLVNRFSNHSAIKQKDIEELLQYKVLSYIPEETKDFAFAINHGLPILSGNKAKGHSLYKSLAKLEM